MFQVVDSFNQFIRTEKKDNSSVSDALRSYKAQIGRCVNMF